MLSNFYHADILQSEYAFPAWSPFDSFCRHHDSILYSVILAY